MKRAGTGPVDARFAALQRVHHGHHLRCRWGEITAVTRRDIDLNTGTITVRSAYGVRSTGPLDVGPPKSRASRRRVDLPRPVVDLLRTHLERYVGLDDSALVFTGPTGRPLRRSNFNKFVGWDRASETLGVPHLHLHDLRHTPSRMRCSATSRPLIVKMSHGRPVKPRGGRPASSV